MTSNLSRVIPLITMIGAIGLLGLSGTSFHAYYPDGQVQSSFIFELPGEIRSQLGYVLIGGATLGAGVTTAKAVIHKKKKDDGPSGVTVQ